MKLAPLKRSHLPQEIASRLRELLFLGELKPGDKLPTERDLAASFNTNRNTLREALKILQEQGFIEARQGSGYFVRDFWGAGTLHLIIPMIVDGWRSPYSLEVLKDMLSFRRLFMSSIVTLGVKNISPSASSKIAQLWEQIKNEPSHEEIFKKDLEIFREVVRATNSVFNMWVFNTIAQVGLSLWDVGVRLKRWRFPDFYFETMERFVNAVVKGDASEARDALEAHLRLIDAFTIRYASSLQEDIS